MQPIGRYAVAGLLLAGVSTLQADTLLLRTGGRVEGRLIGVRGEVVEFEERGRVRRFDRGEIRAIELEPTVYGRPVEDTRPRRPRGLHEREVIVSGDVPFVDSGIDVEDGQRIYFESIGTVWWRRNRKDGPGGNSSEEYNPRLPMPRRPLAALIGKVGRDSSDLFFIGDDPGPVRVRESGRLFLGVNDDYFGDNHGNFRVVVFY